MVKLLFVCGKITQSHARQRFGKCLKDIVTRMCPEGGEITLTDYESYDNDGIKLSIKGKEERLAEVVRRVPEESLIVISRFVDYKTPLLRMDPIIDDKALVINYFDPKSQDLILNAEAVDPKLRPSMKQLISLDLPRKELLLVTHKPIDQRLLDRGSHAR